MKADILKGIYFRIGGKAGATNGLAWHVLDPMMAHLQELITLLAKYELDTDQSPNLEEFELELFDFTSGSAVPAFRIIPKKQFNLHKKDDEQKIIVAERFDQLMSMANTGNYEQFFAANATLSDVNYDVAEELYGFIVSADNSPITVVEPIGRKVYKDIYTIQRFRPDQTKSLLRPRVRSKIITAPENVLGMVEIIGKRKRIVDLYHNKDTMPSISLDQIVLPDKVYHLYSKLLFNVIKEESGYVIENDMLDLYAAGPTIDAAEQDLCIEFDESYNMLMSHDDAELSERLLRAKTMMTNYIREITKD